MRIDKFIAARPINDPKSLSGAIYTFVSGHIADKSVEDYDIYQVGDNVVIVRDECIAVVLASGVAYLRGEEAARKAADYAKKWPRPVKEEKTNA